ncbi:COP9 signalosome complex subunit 3 [Metarhizium album ARSEF 1941]|uniref:COP9 signalosome complex subunit 3 n=1 Tax=Metarhizium album (strain ARSEF 1941) TaxID=1081103 RepID=A0A0B2WZF1_METAS|nr:COP9 signalosome complex subunit 3 [Metarhizium album ARSEF 1941]KHN99418.1 COP9 signalosome complex subunit 3 [Metarhizium album ARSEF 1941]
MAHVHGILTALPVIKPSTNSASKAYDTSIRQHIAVLAKRAAEIRTAVLSSPEPFLQALDPAVHSIGYLVVLDILFQLPDPTTLIPQETLLDKVVDFVLHVDAIQIRYYGQPVRSLLENIGSARFFPPATAVTLLVTAMLRIDPSATVFTSTHLLLAKLAYSSNTVAAALDIFDADILFYPNMGPSRDGRLLCEPSLAPASYMSTQTGLTDDVKQSTVLEYDHIRGLAYMSMRLWSKAREAFEKVMSHPCRERSISKIMVESHKRWILLGLLSQGKPPTVPSYTSASANACYKTTGKWYVAIAEAFSNGDAQRLKSHIEENTTLWEEDGTSSLVSEILSAYQKWQIIGLRQLYQRVGISQVRETTLNAVTGEPLANNQEVLALVGDMIESGMLDGQIEQDGQENYLSFRENSDIVSEAEFAAQIAHSHHTIDLLSKQYQSMNERLSGSKEYVKHLLRDQKRADKDNTDAGIGFDSQIEDEDLMAGIVPNA